MNKMKMAILLAAVCTGVFVTGCKKDDNNNSKTIMGPQAKLGTGSIQSFITLSAAGIPQSIGMIFSESALDNLPQDSTQEYEFPVELPVEAKSTGFDHLAVDWNPFGHEPKQVYGLPHFDFHYYRITRGEQAAVIPGPDTISVPAKFIPQDYTSGVNAVPDMGVHWIDSKSPEFNGQVFTDTFIYGFYHGQLTFMEPMITRAFLLTHPDKSLSIKQPAAFQKAGYYPSVSHVYYNAASKEYTMALEGLRYFPATPQ